MNSSYLMLLEQLGAHHTSHSRRTLLEHLRGTHDLLEEWGNPPDVCVAGLFHSVYGTYIFDKQSADLSMREEIRDVIGSHAERLVYTFCVSDRRRFYEHLGESRFLLADVARGRDMELDGADLAALIEIEVANVVDQVPYRSRKKALAAAELYEDAFARSRSHISVGATKAAELCFSRVRSDAIKA
jgi:hypothetical protein